MSLSGLQVVAFVPKLGQNNAPSLRVMLQALVGPKTLFKNPKKTKHVKI